MVIRITSWRGDHNCVTEPEVARALYDKLTGKSNEPLPAELKTKVPETFEELAGLWTEGTLGYSAIGLDKDGEIIAVKEFDPKAAEVVFLAPITGG